MAIDDNTIYGLYGSQIKDLAGKIEEKQDELTAGDGITIAEESGALVISTDGGSGGIIELTTDDYNYPTTGTPTAVALWLLEPGVYAWESGVNVRVSVSRTLSYGGQAVVSAKSSSIINILVTDTDTFDNTGAYGVWFETGSEWRSYNGLLRKSDVKDNLTSTNINLPLSAYQGKVLNDKIEGRVITGTGAPTTSTVGTVGKLYEDTTNGKLYICTDTTGGSYTWEEVGVGGGGSGVVELTSANYNWPESGTADGVALWKLDPGSYYVHTATKVYRSAASSSSGFANEPMFINIGAAGTNGQIPTLEIKVYNGSPYSVTGYITNDGSAAATVQLLSLNQVVSSTGTSATNVMSQNATTSMVFADPSTKNKVQIGNNAQATGVNTVSIGTGSTAGYNRSSALGAYSIAGAIGATAVGYGSIANTQGEVGFGLSSTYTGTGYNNSDYRLLTGLYDPQSAHDAATKGYVDTAVDAKQDELTAGTGITIEEESGALVISATGGGSADVFTTNEWDALWA